MEIILKEDIIGLGYKNDIVNVKNGYGRNYLIPTGKGVIASPSAKKQLAENLKQQATKLAALKAEAEKKAAQLDGVELVIETKVSATGVTYGSVNAATVVEELAKRGIEIDRKIVTMHDMKEQTIINLNSQIISRSNNGKFFLKFSTSCISCLNNIKSLKINLRHDNSSVISTTTCYNSKIFLRSSSKPSSCITLIKTD